MLAGGAGPGWQVGRDSSPLVSQVNLLVGRGRGFRAGEWLGGERGDSSSLVQGPTVLSLARFTSPPCSLFRQSRSTRLALSHSPLLPLQAIEEYKARLDNPVSGGNGAVFFAVCRGKVSEGLDFSDRAGRGVVITGIPYAMKNDAKVGGRRGGGANTKRACS